MAEKISTIKERVLQVLEYKRVVKDKFFDEIGVSYGNFKGKSLKSALNSDTIAEISTRFSDVSIEWLLTGKGSMLKQAEPPAPLAAEQLLVYTAQGSITEAYNDDIPMEDKVFVSVTGLTGANHRAFRIVGNSMEPLAAERDIVIAKRITDPREVRSGHVYVVAHQTDGVMCKRLYIERKGSNYHIEAACDNELYDSRSYLADEFIEFWHVKAVLKFTLSKAEPDFVKLQRLEKELQGLKKALKNTKSTP